MTITISDYGKALAALADEFEMAEKEVKHALRMVFEAQNSLSDMIQRRDAIQVAMNRITARLAEDLGDSE